MSLGGYAVAVLATLGFVAGSGFTGRRLRRWLAPDWTGPIAAAADLTVILTVVTVIGEILGTAGILSRWPLVAAAIACAAAATRLPNHRGDPQPPAGNAAAGRSRVWRLRAAPIDTLGVLVGVAATAAVGALAVLGLWRNAHTGVVQYDAMHYHLRFAADFAVTHSTRHLLLVAPNSVTPYYPLDDELLHGIGMALWGRDTLTLLIGFIDLLGTYLAIVALLRRRGWPVVALGAAGAGYLLVAYGASTASEGLNDWHTTWLLLAGLVFALAGPLRAPAGELGAIGGRSPLPGAVLAGLATGQAVGTKLDALAAGVAVFAVAVWFARRRTAAAGSFLLAAVLTGGYWYARDAIIVHNPLPELNISLFGHHLPRPPLHGLEAVSGTVLHYLGNGHIVHVFFVAGLNTFFGPLWPVAVLAPLIGLVGVWLRPVPGWTRACSLVALVSIAAYLVTPTSAGGYEGHPILFQYNVRYAEAGLLIGMLLLPVLFSAPWWRLVVIGTQAALVASLLVRAVTWPDISVHRGLAVTAAAVLVAVVGTAWLAARRPGRQVLAGLATLTVVAAVVAGPAFQRLYLSDRYQGSGGLPGLFDPFTKIRDASVGYAGLPLSYPLLGPTWRNHVSYVGRLSGDHGIVEYAGCASWQAALQRDGYRYVVVIGFRGAPPPPQLGWTLRDPAARVLVRDPFGAVFTLDRSPSPASPGGCAGA